jgi:hypothetical protein
MISRSTVTPGGSQPSVLTRPPTVLPVKVFEIIATLVGSLAWPIVVLVVVLVLREPLRNLASSDPSRRSLKRAKVGPVEVEWDSLDEARAAVAAEQPPSALSVSPGSLQDPEVGHLLHVAELHPTAGIMAAFQRVEAELIRALKASGHTVDRRQPMARLTSSAEALGLLSSSNARLLDSLRVVRNEVAHSYEPEDVGVTPARAINYVLASEEVVQNLRQVPSQALPPTNK